MSIIRVLRQAPLSEHSFIDLRRDWTRYMTRRNGLKFAVIALIMGVAVHLANFNPTCYVRLNLLLRGLPFARLVPATTYPGSRGHAWSAPNEPASEIILRNNVYRGYVTTN